MAKVSFYIEKNIPLLAEALVEIGDIVNFDGDSLKNIDVKSHSCQILIVRSTTTVSKDLLDGAAVRIIGSATSGTDHVDIDFLRSSGILFSDASGSNTNAVAEYVVYCILCFLQTAEVQDLKCHTLGIVGYGKIGQRVAGYAAALGLNIKICDPLLSEAGAVSSCHYDSLDDILQYCTLVTVHTPLTKTGQYPTYNLIHANCAIPKQLRCVIQTSRGSVISEDFLREFKLSNKNNFVAVDVWENEPDFAADIAQSADISTAHIAGHTENGKIIGSAMMAVFIEQATGLHPNYTVFPNEFLEAAKSLYATKNNCDIIHNFSPNSASIALLSNNRELFTLLKNSRNIDADNAALKTISLCTEKNMRLQKFQYFRSNYPKRKEILS